MSTCGCCGRNARRRVRALLVHGLGGGTKRWSTSSVCPTCAKTGVLVVCAEPHLTMAQPKKRKPTGIAAALVSLVLAGCGGLVETDTREGVPMHSAEGGATRVEERDSGLDGHAIECTPDAEAHTGILCMHPKRRGDAR